MSKPKKRGKRVNKLVSEVVELPKPPEEFFSARAAKKFLIFTNPISIALGAGALQAIVLRRLYLALVKGVVSDLKKLSKVLD